MYNIIVIYTFTHNSVQRIKNNKKKRIETKYVQKINYYNMVINMFR